MWGRLAALCLTLFVGACVQANATSYRDPAAYKGQVYQKVLVMALGLPLDQTQAAEAAAAEAIGPTAVQSLTAIPLSIRQDNEALRDALMAISPDAALVIEGIEAGTTSSNLPVTYTPGTSYSTVNVIGNYAYVNTYSSPGRFSGGGTVTKPRASFAATIYDTSTGSLVWKASIETRGSAYDDFVGLAAGAGKEAVAQARKDGLLR